MGALVGSKGGFFDGWPRSTTSFPTSSGAAGWHSVGNTALLISSSTLIQVIVGVVQTTLVANKHLVRCCRFSKSQTMQEVQKFSSEMGSASSRQLDYYILRTANEGARLSADSPV